MGEVPTEVILTNCVDALAVGIKAIFSTLYQGFCLWHRIKNIAMDMSGPVPDEAGVETGQHRHQCYERQRLVCTGLLRFMGAI